MMMAAPTEYIEINDFSPGIHGDYNASGNSSTNTTNVGTLRGAIPAGNGAATVENTYDCTADLTGALIPLPRATNGVTQQVLPGGNTQAGQTTRMPASMNASYLLDAVIVPDTYGAANDPTGFDRIYTVWNYRYSPANDSTYSTFVHGRQYRTGGSLPLYDFLFAKYTHAWPGQFASASMAKVRLATLYAIS
jgi:hypothetical protein